MDRFSKSLDALKDKNRFRSLAPISGIDLSSNDYLGFRDHPFLKDAARAAIENGISMGAGGSRLLRGHCPEHQNVEEQAETFFGAPKTLFFANGYQANTALFSTLPTRHDVIIFDELIHASARDGIQSSHAKRIKVKHNDLESYEAALKKYADKAEYIWIAIEALYSMDGDIAPLPEIYALAKQYGAYVVVDEAHSTGVFGQNGQGLSSHDDYEQLITLHTCGKALGVAGGLVCASEDIIVYLINKARPFIYSTAPPPLQAYLVSKALELCRSDIGDRQREKLWARVEQIRGLMNKQDLQSQIVPIVLGEDTHAVSVAKKLQSQGYDIRAIRPPTVPEGTARLRISLQADLEEGVLPDLWAFLEPLL